MHMLFALYIKSQVNVIKSQKSIYISRIIEMVSIALSINVGTQTNSTSHHSVQSVQMIAQKNTQIDVNTKV